MSDQGFTSICNEIGWMINVEEVFACWQLWPDVVFFEIACSEHWQRTSQHEEVVNWKNQLDFSMIKAMSLHNFPITSVRIKKFIWCCQICRSILMVASEVIPFWVSAWPTWWIFRWSSRVKPHCSCSTCSSWRKNAQVIVLGWLWSLNFLHKVSVFSCSYWSEFFSFSDLAAEVMRCTFPGGVLEVSTILTPKYVVANHRAKWVTNEGALAFKARLR